MCSRINPDPIMQVSGQVINFNREETGLRVNITLTGYHFLFLKLSYKFYNCPQYYSCYCENCQKKHAHTEIAEVLLEISANNRDDEGNSDSEEALQSKS